MKTKAYKIRLYPNSHQRILLNKHFGCVRSVWNKCVEAFNKCENISLEEIKSEDYFGEVSAACLQQKYRDFQAFKKRFFGKGDIGRPKFKKKSIYNAFRTTNQKLKLSDKKVRLEKIGWVKAVFNRKIEGRVLSATVSKNSANEYYISIVCEIEIKPLPESQEIVGIDLGIKNLMVTSDGLIIDNPKFLRDKQAEISELQKHLSRKKKGSRRWKKVKLKIAKLYQKVVNQRKYFLHQITNYIVNRYGKIFIEDLTIENMKTLGKHDASMGELVSQLTYKCEWYGRELNKIDKYYPSTQTCSQCGHLNKIGLNERVYECGCGLKIDRDLNSALNIKAVGVNAAVSEETNVRS